MISLRTLGGAVACLALAWLAVTPADAASFDCAKAKTALEKTICGDAGLSELDTELAAAFKAASDAIAAEDRAALLADQRKWLAGRTTPAPEWEACEETDAACLGRLYKQRLREFSDITDHPREAMANLLWTAGVVCRGGQALIRFRPGNDSADNRRMPPDIGGALAKAPADRDHCKLADGRTVRLKVGGMGDELPYGECGGDESSIYSVWIGDRKVINRELQVGKCGWPYTVRAVFLDGRKLTECREVATGPGDESPKQECKDISVRLTQAQKDDRKPGSFIVSESAKGQEAFCKGLIHGTDGYADGSIWPQKTALPDDVPDTDELETKPFDLNNSGKPQHAFLVHGDSHFFDGAFWLIPPAGMAEDTATAVAAGLPDDKPLDDLRKQGFQVFAGDQTAFKEPRYVTLTPFFKNGRTWLHARYVQLRLDQPSEIVTAPQPDGSLKTVCVFLSTPDL